MSAVLDRTQGALPWRPALLALGAVLLAVLLLFRETFTTMVGIWTRSETFAHAYLVLPISLWLVWRQRSLLSQMVPKPQPWILLPIMVAGAGWLVGELATVNAVTQFMVVTLLVLAVPAVLGMPVAWAIAFPLAFLFFMVPVGEFLLPVLMEYTADFTVWAVRLSGVPLYREGLQFVIPSGQWSVVEACSGVRYLIASFMVGTLFAYINYRSMRRRLIFCAISVVVPIVANWLRAYMIVMLGHLSDNRIATGVDHILYGWVFFGVVIMLMFFIGARWSEHEPSAPEAPPAPRADGAPAPVRWWLAGLVVAAVAWPHFAHDQIEHQVLPGTPKVALPATLAGGWVAEPAPADGYKPTFVGASAQTEQTYRRGDRSVGVYVAYYRAQAPGRKVASSDNVLVHSSQHHLNQVSLTEASLPGADAAVPYRRAEVLLGSLSNGSRERLEIRQVYRVGQRWAGSPEWAAVLVLLARLSGEGDDAASVVLHVRGEDTRATGATLDDFMRDQLGALEAVLAQARRST